MGFFPDNYFKETKSKPFPGMIEGDFVEALINLKEFKDMLYQKDELRLFLFWETGDSDSDQILVINTILNGRRIYELSFELHQESSRVLTAKELDYLKFVVQKFDLLDDFNKVVYGEFKL